MILYLHLRWATIITLSQWIVIMAWAVPCVAQDDDPAAIEALRNSGANISNEYFGVVSEDGNARSITFMGPDIVDEDLEALQGLHSVHQIVLRGTNVTDAAFAHMAHLAHLQVIYISNKWNEGSFGETYTEYIEDPAVITGSGFIHLTEIHLRYLAIQGTELNDDSLETIAEALLQCEHLSEVNLLNNEISSEGLSWLADQFPQGVHVPESIPPYGSNSFPRPN